ncbi:hypothetical protein OSH11_20160 [Kaistia dalseonensis]|uniref:DUF8173 domain-containing protein n=1 Tax=Kaistia dalseonensis TaxID=410840 RepID=A0ABU0HBH5_9HYPH|nr:hypothetical protein [Kaistia dalseonensis]MCX5497030.1 hypothetical protein [Kaistia dalseonensis]MDQ0439656.1 hypothetical protein [Kaistia dalseonensis]
MARFFKLAARAAFVLLLLGGAASADDDGGSHRFGNSLFTTGMDVRVGQPGLRGLFAAGETVAIDSDISGTAHAAGRNVRFDAAVGGDAYAIGYSVSFDAPVTGDVTAAGYAVNVGAKGSIGGEAILGARYVNIDGPIAGNALLTGDVVEIGAPISGSAEIRAREIRFGPGAHIGGNLTYWSDRALNIPAEVIAPEKVTANIVAPPPVPPGMTHFIGGALMFLAVLLVAGVLLVWILMPVLADARGVLTNRPWRTFFAGIITLSALFGSVFVLSISLIGIPLVPVIILLIPFLLIAGYLTSAYVVGGALLDRVTGRISASRWAAIGAILVGLVVLSILHAIPIFGWVVGVVATLLGLGALAQRALTGRPSAVAGPL